MMTRVLASNGRLAVIPFLATLGLFGYHAAQAQTVDGTRDASYPASLAVQTVNTGFGDNTNTDGNTASGSELDNITAKIVGSDLYLFIGGNIQGDDNTFNKVDLFFDTKTGGQNTLGNSASNNYVDAMNGLTFDAGLNADYALSVTAGVNTSTTPGVFGVYVDFTDTPAGGSGTTSTYVGGGTPGSVGASQVLTFPGGGSGEVALNNSNTGGVTDNNTNGHTNSYAGDASTVNTGIELKIPLSALGTSVNGGNIRITAFINNPNHNYLSNQVLGPLPAMGNLGGDGNGNYTGGTAGVNFANLAGNQYVTVTNSVATSPTIGVNPTTLAFNNKAQNSTTTQTFSVSNSGTGALNVTGITSTNGSYTASPSTFTIAAGGPPVPVTVTFHPTATGPQNGTLSIASNDAGSPTTVSVSGNSVAAGSVVVDGTVDSGLYTQKALQTNYTGYGDNQNELDGAYVRVDGSNLYLTLTGNLEFNSDITKPNNRLLIFFDVNPKTGQTTFANNNSTTGNSFNLAGLQFDRGFKPESFIAVNRNQNALFLDYVQLDNGATPNQYLSNTTDFTQTLNFSNSLKGEASFDDSNMAGVTAATASGAASATTGLELRLPLSALGSGITSTTPIHVMAVIVNGDFDNVSNQTLGGLPFNTANLGSPSSTDLGSHAGNQFFTAQVGDVTVDDTRAIAGDYRNITVSSAGVAQVYSPLSVTGTLQATGGLAFQVPGDASAPEDAYVSGGGSTVVTSALSVSSADGITAGAAATGNVRTTGGRSFSTSADYTYLGGAQTSGSGLAGARNLTKSTAGALTLNSPVGVSQIVAATGGNIVSGSNLTLLSSASGTALAVNGGGNVTGAATVQRYIGGISGPGYRMLAAPVTTTVADLGASINSAAAVDYNTNPSPSTVTPFPTLFVYDQTRAGTITSDLSAFNQGFFAVQSAGRGLNPGDGVDYNTTGNQTVSFTGQLNNAAYGTNANPVALANNGNAAGGWALLGNPFPAPISWDDVTLNGSVSNTVYVSKATSQYSGTYTSYTKGSPMQPAPNTGPVIPLGQAFFVHAQAGGGSIEIPTTARVKTFDGTLHAVQRQAADTRTALRLALTGTATQEPDYAAVYFNEQATSGYDVQFDAEKLFNTGANLNLYTSAAGQALALNALPLAGNAAVVVPVQVRVPAAGTYALSLHEVMNLAAGSTLELRDALTGTRTVLTQGTSYSFSTSTNAVTGRFTLVLNGTSSPLATAGQALAAQIGVYPNPAHGQFRLELPLLSAAQVAGGVRAELLNVLGQVVRQLPLNVVAGQASQTDVSVRDLNAGIYQLRLTVNGTQAVRRVVVE